MSKTSRGLIRSMMIIGSAQAVNILLSILRMKVLAVLLGPAGVGLLGIYNNLQEMVGNAAGLGMRSSGVRQLASARGEDIALDRVRRVLFLAHLVQGILAMTGVWLLRVPIAEWLFGDSTRAIEVGLVGVAILLTLMGAAQSALLQGLRRIGDLGRVTVLGALGGTLVGLAAVWLYGISGLIWFVLVQPLTAFLVALFFTRQLPKPKTSFTNLGDFWADWKPMAKLGAVFMLGGLTTTATLLVVRSWLTRDLGLDAAGQFAAAWGITMTYVGFLLTAMGADYFPRLTEVINDRVAANRLMNDQAQLSLAIGGPVLLLLIGMAPWVILLLYSSNFDDAVTLLQWQSVGNLFKLACWSLGFSFVAAARSRIFFFTQINFNIVFVLLIWFGLPVFGLEITGIAFMIGYIMHFGVLNMLAYRLQGFRWDALSLKLLAVHTVLAFGLLVLSLAAPVAGAVTSVIMALATGFVGGHIVLTKVGSHGRAAPIARAYNALGWPIRSHA